MPNSTDHAKTDDGGEAGTGDTRPQKGGEGGTTRFGMENSDGDDTDVPAAGRDPDQQGGTR